MSLGLEYLHFEIYSYNKTHRIKTKCLTEYKLKLKLLSLIYYLLTYINSGNDLRDSLGFEFRNLERNYYALNGSTKDILINPLVLLVD